MIKKIFDNSKNNPQEYYYSGNSFASTLTDLAILLLIIEIIGGIYILKEIDSTYGIITLVSSVITFLLIYAKGKELDMLSDIRENTEYLRDSISNDKKNNL